MAGFKRIFGAGERVRSCHLNNIRSLCNNSSPAIKRVCLTRSGFWKINISAHLSDERFIQDLSSKIPEFKTKHDYLDDKGLYWDMIKMETRGFCVQYTKQKKNKKQGTPKHLKAPQQQIDQLMNQLKNDRTKENISKLYRLREEYNAIAEYRTKGAIIRSRIRWHENGEKKH